MCDGGGGISLNFPQGMKSKYSSYILILIMIVGIIFRVLFFLQFTKTPFSRHPLLDAQYYHDVAQEVAQGHIIQNRAFFMSPFYPFALGLWYALLGPRLWIAPVLQMILGIITCFFLYRIGTRLFSPATGLLAAAFYSLYKPALFYEQTILMETSLGFIYLILLLIIVEKGEQEKPGWWMVIGLILGIASLCRANVLLFFPVLILWCAWNRKLKIERSALRSLLVRMALLLGGMLLCILPATLHNYLAEKDFVLIGSNSGINLFIGNNPNAKGYFDPVPGVDWMRDMWGAQQAERALGRFPLKSSEISRYWKSRAFTFIREYPLSFINLLFVKFYYFWGTVELDQILSMQQMSSLMPVLSWPLFNFRILGPLALAGLFLCVICRERRRVILALFIITYVLSLLPFFMTDRYRIPAVPLLCVAAAFTLVHVVELVKKKDWRRLSYTGGAVALLVFVLDNSSVLSKRQSAEAFHNSLGVMYQAEGRLDDALREYYKALEYSKVSTIYNNLGSVYLLKKDYLSAVRNYKEAYDMDPENAKTCFQLGLSCVYAHRLDAARLYLEKSLSLDPRIDPMAYYNLAFLYLSKGEKVKAQNAMKTYLRMNPQDKEVWNTFLRYGGDLKE